MRIVCVCPASNYILPPIGGDCPRFGGQSRRVRAEKNCRPLQNVKLADGGGLTVFVNFNI